LALSLDFSPVEVEAFSLVEEEAFSPDEEEAFSLLLSPDFVLLEVRLCPEGERWSVE
jgi:hypothetical protein